MKKLSSKTTFFFKRVFPIMWFGFLGIFLFIPLLAGGKGNGPDIMFIIVPIFMAIVGYIIMKKLVFDLIDEVYDEGNTLLFKNGGKEVRINLTDIKNISYSTAVNPPRVTISVRYETQMGKDLTFSPPASLIPFRKNKDIEELIDRVDTARGYRDRNAHR
jgi:hypothetical protein